jgi:DNA-binding NarL/FixJ family response regulator
MSRPRVLLAEDHPAVADHLRGLLEEDCDVVAVVADGYAMLGAAETLKPDVIVADISMPGMDGMVAAERIIKADLCKQIVFVTVHNEPALLEQAMKIGARGYVLKGSAGEELVAAVQAVLRGETFVSVFMRRK